MRETSESGDQALLDEVARARTAARRQFEGFADIGGQPSESFDPENPPLSEDQLSALRPAVDVHPGLVAASLRRRTGRPKSQITKTAVSLRLDVDVVDALRAQGPGWQTQVNALLRASLKLAP